MAFFPPHYSVQVQHGQAENCSGTDPGLHQDLHGILLCHGHRKGTAFQRDAEGLALRWKIQWKNEISGKRRGKHNTYKINIWGYISTYTNTCVNLCIYMDIYIYIHIYIYMHCCLMIGFWYQFISSLYQIMWQIQSETVAHWQMGGKHVRKSSTHGCLWHLLCQAFTYCWHICISIGINIYIYRYPIHIPLHSVISPLINNNRGH